MMLSDDPRVRAVVANTNLYNTRNDATNGEEDPGDQFKWLEELLEQAKDDNEKVVYSYRLQKEFERDSFWNDSVCSEIVCCIDDVTRLPYSGSYLLLNL